MSARSGNQGETRNERRFTSDKLEHRPATRRAMGLWKS